MSAHGKTCGAAPVLAALLLAGPAGAAEPACAAGAPGQISGFVVPPVPPPAVRRALAAGRQYLRRGEREARACGKDAPGPPSGYVVVTLRPGRVTFSAPEPIPQATLRCLSRVAKNLGGIPTAFAAEKRGGPRDGAGMELQEVWLLRDKAAPGREAPLKEREAPAGRRTFAEIGAEVDRHLPALASCLQALWQDRPHARGTLVLRLLVAEHGGVDEATVHRSEPTLAAAEPCLLKIAARLRFPPRPGQGRTVMTYPIVVEGEGQGDDRPAP